MAERGTTSTILWDLDGTIGDFRGMRIGNPEVAQPILLRYGIHELLSEFSAENGYRNWITSSSPPGFINEALNRSYLNRKFEKIFGRDDVQQTDYGKHYSTITRGNRDEDIHAQMIVIGDSERDKPVDIGGLVFVELGTSPEPHEALVIREIITTLLDRGDGNFKKGYEAMYAQAEPKAPSYPGANERRELSIGNDIAFSMEYRTADEVKAPALQRVPVICSIKSDTHKKPFQPFF